MSVLVDTSVWVEYFRHGRNLEKPGGFLTCRLEACATKKLSPLAT